MGTLEADFFYCYLLSLSMVLFFNNLKKKVSHTQKKNGKLGLILVT